MACHIGDRKGPQSLYKGRFAIVFYDKTGEQYINSFNNIREILAFKGEEITRSSINKMNVILCKELKTDNHHTRLLDGTLMTVWLVNDNDDDSDLVLNEGERL